MVSASNQSIDKLNLFIISQPENVSICAYLMDKLSKKKNNKRKKKKASAVRDILWRSGHFHACVRPHTHEHIPSPAQMNEFKKLTIKCTTSNKKNNKITERNIYYRIVLGH